MELSMKSLGDQTAVDSSSSFASNETAECESSRQEIKHELSAEIMDDIREPEGVLPYSPENYPKELPEFQTEEELREFWDTHDASYYFDQFEDVTDSPPPQLLHRDPSEPSTARRRPDAAPMELISLRFPTEMIESIRAIAKRRHLPYQTMVRSWVAERMEQELRLLDRKG